MPQELLHGSAPEVGQEITRVRSIFQKFSPHSAPLSSAELENALGNCRFLKGKDVRQLTLQTPVSWAPFQDSDILREAIEMHKGELLSPSTGINIVRADFQRFGVHSYGAFYSHEYNSLFLNDGSSQSFSDQFEKAVYSHALRLHLDKKLKGASESSLPLEEKNAAVAAIKNNIEDTRNNPGRLASIPPQILAEFSAEIENYSKDWLFQKALEKVVTQTNVQHELFHYFYDNFFGKEGYGGPDVAHALAEAISGGIEKFGAAPLKYGSDEDIRNYLKRVDANEPGKLLDFCIKVTEGVDITSRPRSVTQEELGSLSDAEMDKQFMQSAFFAFLTEYLARIYNGYLGNTGKSVKPKIENVEKVFGLKAPKLPLETTYHIPSERDARLLMAMKLNGVSILP